MTDLSISAFNKWQASGGLTAQPSPEVQPKPTVPAEQSTEEDTQDLSLASFNKWQAGAETSTAGTDTMAKAKDYLYGSLVELPRDLAYQAVSYLPAQAARFATVGGEKLGESIGLLEPKTPQEQAEIGRNVGDWVRTLGGTAVPTTTTAQASEQLAGKVFEPVHQAAEWATQKIDKDKYPNLHDLASSGVELGIFAAIPSIGGKFAEIAKERSELATLAGKERIDREAQLKIDQEKALKAAEDAIKTGELKRAIQDRAAPNKGSIAPDQVTAQTKQHIEQATTLDQADNELRQANVPESSVMPMSAQSVVDILVKPIKDESGSIINPFRRASDYQEYIAPEIRERVQKISKAAEDAGVPLEDYLKKYGVSSETINELNKAVDMSRREAPMSTAFVQPKMAKDDFNFFGLSDPDAVKVNVSDKAHTGIVVDTNDLARLAQIKPEQARGGLKSWLEPSDYMFDRYPTLKPLLSQSREISAAIKKELEAQADHLKEIESQFSSKKDRIELGKWWHAQSELGRDAMAKMGVQVPKNVPKYAELKNRLEPLFEDLYNRINEARVKIGMKPIAHQGDYLSFFAKDSLITDIHNLFHGEAQGKEAANLVLDDGDIIRQRQGINIKDETIFSHIRRTGLKDGVSLVLDPLEIYAKYLDSATRHIYMSPLNAFVSDLLGTSLKDPITGKSGTFTRANAKAAAEISSWNNKLAGSSNFRMPKPIEKIATVGMQHLTAAQLFGNLRTAIVQLSALFPTYVKYGLGHTLRGVYDTMLQRKGFDAKEIPGLTTAVMDVAVDDMARVIAGTRRQKAGKWVLSTTAKPMQWLDYFSREATARTVWNQLEPLVREGKMTRQEVARKIDSEIVRTQGSGAVTELSPIQRNTLGRMLTLWQTYTINHAYFIAKDVLGIHNPELKPREAAIRTMRYIAGMLAINYLFEKGLGVQSPLPAPEYVLADNLKKGSSAASTLLALALESTEFIPFGSSIKYGGSPMGPIADYAQSIEQLISGNTPYHKDVLSGALNGNRQDQILVGKALGQTLGIPGTSQAVKYARGRLKGKSGVQSLMGQYTKDTTAGKLKTSFKLPTNTLKTSFD